MRLIGIFFDIFKEAGKNSSVESSLGLARNMPNNLLKVKRFGLVFN